MIGARKFRTRAAQRRERTRFVVRVVLLALLVVSVCGAVLYAIHRPEVRVQNIFVNTDGSIETATVVTAVHEVIDRTYFHLVPKNSSLFVPLSEIERSLTKAFPRVADVSVQRSGMQGLGVRITERAPVALWCGDVVPPIAYGVGSLEAEGREEVWGNCYLVDPGGFLYAPAPIYTGNVFPRYYGSLTLASPIGQNILTQDEFNRFQSLFTQVTGTGHTLAAVLVTDERDIELYMDTGVRILALRADVPDAIGQRLRALFSSSGVSFSQSITYIDMRFDNKVYVKYDHGPVNTADETVNIE